MRPRIISIGFSWDKLPAIDYGWSGLVAIGSVTTVLVVDAQTSRCVQSLQGHRTGLTKVLWAPENYYHDEKNPFLLRLASADSSGVIIIWDVLSSHILCEFSGPECSVLDMQWLNNQDITRDILAVLHSKGRFVLWNTQTQSQLWVYVFAENVMSFCIDPFTYSNIIFHASDRVIFKQFSLLSPLSTKAKIVHIMDIVTETTKPSAPGPEAFADGHAQKSIKSAITEIFFSGNAESSAKKNGDSNFDTIKPRNLRGNCLQVLYHQYLKDCFILVFRREVIVLNSELLRPISVITLANNLSSFSQVYSCTQRDVLMCLLDNGTLTVYARHGLASPISSCSSCEMPSNEMPNMINLYELIAVNSPSRRKKQAHRVNFAIDPCRELSAAIATIDGRVQCWCLQSVCNLPWNRPNPVELNYTWCLSDLLPTREYSTGKPKLYLELKTMYIPSKVDATVCRVCPSHFTHSRIPPTSGSLVAVGNARGDIQVWDLSAALLLREFHVLPVAVIDIIWVLVPRTFYKSGDSVEPRSTSPISIRDDPSKPHDDQNLGLLIYGWQPKDTTNVNRSTQVEYISGKPTSLGRNYLVILDLCTGYVRGFRDPLSVLGPNASKVKVTNPFRRLLTKSNDGDQSLDEPAIDSIRVSYLSQFATVLIKKRSVEVWRLWNCTLLNKIELSTDIYAVALDWCQSLPKSRINQIAKLHSKNTMALISDSKCDSLLSLAVPISRKIVRESCIVCTSDGTVRLIVVTKCDLDSTAVSGAILKGLPPGSHTRINLVSWFSDLIAFGTSDGCIAVRDLHNKKTTVKIVAPKHQTNNTSHNLDHSNVEASVQCVDPDLISDQTNQQQHLTSAPVIRDLAFVSGPSNCTRLLSLQVDSLRIWEPRRMLLLCMSSFTGPLQYSVLSADWALPILSPSDRAMCILLTGDGALRLVQCGQGTYEMIITSSTNADDTSATNSLNRDSTSKIFGCSSVADVSDNNANPVLVPALLPYKSALLVRHILQNQPWRETSFESPNLKRHNSDASNPVSLTSCKLDDSNDSANADSQIQQHSLHRTTYQLTCPILLVGFAKIQNSVSIFLRGLQKRSDVANTFCNPSATIIERCLWTAQLFGDAYEVRFWFLAASTLLDKSKASRYFLDLSWDLLSDVQVYKRNMDESISYLSKTQLSSMQRKKYIDSLLLLGYVDRAVSLLLDTPNESDNYNLNMYRACLLAANAVRKSCDNSTANQTAIDNYLCTVKLVATNLLSNGQLTDGIGLLCLIDSQADACRYLESFDQWERSIWLAKCTLSKEECAKVMHRWASYLASPQVNRKDYAVLVYILLEKHVEVLKLLHSLHQYQLAVRYLEACFELNKLERTSETEVLFASIFTEFGHILTKLGHTASANYYWQLSKR